MKYMRELFAEDFGRILLPERKNFGRAGYISENTYVRSAMAWVEQKSVFKVFNDTVVINCYNGVSNYRKEYKAFKRVSLGCSV